MASYAAIATDNTAFKFEPTNTLLIHKGNTVINIPRFVEDMVKQGLWKGIRGMQNSKSHIELCCIEDEIKNKLLTEGVNTHDQHLLVTSEMPLFTNVSLMGVPLELPPHVVELEMRKYGDIKSSFMVKKKIGGLVVFNGVRVYQFLLIKRHIPRNISMYGRKVRVIYTGQPMPVKVDMIRNKDIVNAGGELPEEENVDVEAQVMEVTEAQEHDIVPVTLQDEVLSLSDIENSQAEETNKSPPIVNNNRKRNHTNIKPPSDDDDDTIENQIFTKHSIGQTQVRSYVIRRKFSPKKLILFKQVNNDILNQLCATVLISDVGTFNRDFNGGELTEGVKTYWKLYSKNSRERNNSIQLNVLTEINKVLQQKKIRR